MVFTNLQTLKEVKLYNLFEKLTDRSTAAFLADCLTAETSEEQVAERQAFFRKLEDEAFYSECLAQYDHMCLMKKAYDSYVDKDDPLYRSLTFFRMLDQYYYFTDDAGMKADIENVRALYEVERNFHCRMFSKYDNQRYSVELSVTDKELKNPLKGLFDYLELKEDSYVESYRIYGSLYEMIKATDPRPFDAMDGIFLKYRDRVLPGIESVLARLPKLRFFLEMKRFYNALSARHIPYVMAEFTDEREFSVHSARDITLITSNVENIISNDFYFTEEKRFWFITGANGGGKTSFLRSVGLCLILGRLGCYMPARYGRLYRINKLISFFPMEEDLARGRFFAEKERLAAAIAETDSDTMLLMNEVFTSTDEEKARTESQAALEEILERHCFGVFVTHNFPLIDSMSDRMPVLEALTEGDEHSRLFKIVEKKQGGSSFAEDVLRKYGLDGTTLRRKYNDFQTERGEAV